MNNSLSVLILTYNEELHIERCIKSLKLVTNNIYVVDSFSSDSTEKICKDYGVNFYQRAWINYADQFQWGLDNIDFPTEWVMRMDADEYLESELIVEINKELSFLDKSVSGIYIPRKYFFMGKWIKHGGIFPLYLLRIWKKGKGRIESRWMDEHIVLDNNESTMFFKSSIVDDNLNNTSWYIEKHNKYASREMLDILISKYNLLDYDSSLDEDTSNKQARIKRFLKNKVYNKLPIFVRPILYFLYRYILLLGFLDGKKGFAFHFMQGLWYRSLVDLRVYEAELKIKGLKSNSDVIEILSRLTKLDLK